MQERSDWSVPTTNQKLTTTAVTQTATGDAVSAVAGQAVYLFSGFLVASATLTLTIRDGTTALTGAMTMIAGVPYNLRELTSGQPHLVTTAGNALNLLQSGAGTIAGWVKTAQV